MIGKGIRISTGFDLNSQSPLDSRTVFKTIEERDALPNINLYEGLKCFIEDTKENYQYKNGEWVNIDAWDDIIVTSDVDNKKTILSFYSNTILKKQIELDESIDPNELNIWDDAIVTKDEINNRNVISFYSNGTLQKTIYIDGLGENTNIKEIKYGDTAPTDENILLWIDTTSDNGASSLLSDALILEFKSVIADLNSQIADLKARVLYLEQNGGGGGTIIVGVSYISLEDGTQLMLEDGTPLLLESSEYEEEVETTTDVIMISESENILMTEDGAILLLDSSEYKEINDILMTLEDGTILTFGDGTQMTFE